MRAVESQRVAIRSSWKTEESDTDRGIDTDRPTGSNKNGQGNAMSVIAVSACKAHPLRFETLPGTFREEGCMRSLWRMNFTGQERSQ